MSYPTAAQVLAGVMFGAADEVEGTLEVPAVGDVKEGVTFGAAGADTGTYPLTEDTAAAQLATDVAAVTAAKANILLAGNILGVAGDGLTDEQLQQIRTHPLLKL